MALAGGCSCGAIRYKLTNSPSFVHACHCRDCQRITGGPFAINIWIERKFVDSAGAEPKSFVLKGGSGERHEVFFCGKCGTYVWSRYSIVPNDCLFVRAGTLDNPKVGSTRRSHLHAEQAAMATTPKECASVQVGLQDRQGLAGQQGADA